MENNAVIVGGSHTTDEVISQQRLDAAIAQLRSDEAWDTDREIMLSLILQGKTSWKASKLRSTESMKTPGALYSIARQIETTLLLANRPIQKWIEELFAAGRVTDVPPVLIGQLRQAVRALGRDITESITVTVSPPD